MKKTIVVVYGGRSGEHEVSKVSAASVARNLDGKKFDVLLVGIEQNGLWYLQDDDELVRCRAGAESLRIKVDPGHSVAIMPGGGKAMAFLRSGGTPIPADVVFPVLHGSYGEDGTIQGLLEMADLPYVGGGVLGSAIGMDKEIAKALWLQAGLPTVPYIAMKAHEWAHRDKRDGAIERAERDFRYPLFVKPSCAGSSVGASKATSRADLDRAVQEAFRWDDKVLIEPFLAAREIECSVTGNERMEAYTPGEVVPTHEFYDYEAKYVDPNGAALLIPADLSEADLRRIRELALKAYRTAELSGLARVDFFMRKDTGELLLNEVNTMPGFTTISMFPKMCEASGLAYGPLLERLIQLGEDRHALRSARSFTYRRSGAPRKPEAAADNPSVHG